MPGAISTRATRYAEAAFAVALAGDQIDAWLDALQQAATIFADSAAERYLTSPLVAPERKLVTLREALPNASPPVANFLAILVHRSRLDLLPDVFRVFRRLVNEHRGVQVAQVTTARPIDERQQRQIATRLSSMTGKHIELETAIDASIIGGVVAHVGDNVIDASIRGRLDRLRRALTA